MPTQGREIDFHFPPRVGSANNTSLDVERFIGPVFAFNEIDEDMEVAAVVEAEDLGGVDQLLAVEERQMQIFFRRTALDSGARENGLGHVNSKKQCHGRGRHNLLISLGDDYGIHRRIIL